MKEYYPNSLLAMLIGFLLTTLPITNSFSQSPVERKISFHLVAGGGASWFKVHDLPETPRYTSAEVLAGLGVRKPIGKRLSVMSGLALGVKFRRESYFFGPYGNYTREPTVVLGLDDTASKKGGYYIRVPLALALKMNRIIEIYSGLQGRFWGPSYNDNGYRNVLTGVNEIGILAGGSIQLPYKLSMGIEFFSGFTDFYYGATWLSTVGRYLDLKVTNQNLMLVVRHPVQFKK